MLRSKPITKLRRVGSTKESTTCPWIKIRVFSGYCIACSAVSGCPTKKLKVFAIQEPFSATLLGGEL